MPLVSMRQLLDHAAEFEYGLPAFNVNNMEQLHAVLGAAREVDSPAIIAASAGARTYAGEPFLRHLMLAAVEAYPTVPVAVHQDHGATLATCVQSVASGFTSVMMDGSLLPDAKTPATYEYNTNATARVVELSHAVGVTVEGEIGVLGSLERLGGEQEDGHGAVEGVVDRERLLTDPEEAARFVADTGVDALAIAIGTSHGAYKFSQRPTGDVLVMDRVKEIHARLPNTHLVMHGSSSVPQEWIAILNEFGGEMRPTFGVPVEEIQEGIRHGVRKINIDTDIRLVMTAAVRRHLTRNRSEFDPRAYLREGIVAVRRLCAERYEQFGSAGHGHAIIPVALEEMSRRYATGDLGTPPVSTMRWPA